MSEFSKLRMDRSALRWVGCSRAITMVKVVQAFWVLARLWSENAASAICVSDFQTFRMVRFALRWVAYSRVITMVKLIRASRSSIGCFTARKRGDRDLHVCFPEFQNGTLCSSLGRLQPCDHDGNVDLGFPIINWLLYGPETRRARVACLISQNLEWIALLCAGSAAAVQSRW